MHALGPTRRAEKTHRLTPLRRAHATHRSLPLPIALEQFVQAEREICTHSQEQRSPRSRKNREIERPCTPKAIVIVSANVVRRTPLSKAVMRVFQPRTSRRPKRVSAAVAIIANAGIIATGKNQLSLAV